MATTWTSGFWRAFRKTIRPIRPKLLNLSVRDSPGRQSCSPVNSNVNSHFEREDEGLKERAKVGNARESSIKLQVQLAFLVYRSRHRDHRTLPTVSNRSNSSSTRFAAFPGYNLSRSDLSRSSLSFLSSSLDLPCNSQSAAIDNINS